MDIPEAGIKRMKINMGAGHKRYPGFTNVDAVAREGIDVVSRADEVPLPDGCADELMAIHLCEHLHQWELPKALKEWARLLAPGGQLVLEMPDLIKCCKNIIAGVKGKHPDSLGLFGLYGDYRLQDEFMMHKFAYTFDTLAPLVKEAGFIKIKEAIPEHHRVGRLLRDFRLEARKPESV